MTLKQEIVYWIDRIFGRPCWTYRFGPNYSTTSEPSAYWIAKYMAENYYSPNNYERIIRYKHRPFGRPMIEEIRESE